MRANQHAEAIRIFGANVESKPAPFLQNAQKKCGTHASFHRGEGEAWCRAATE
jgi:hypothetical protein